MDLILASTSPHRRALLGRLGLPFRCVAPDVDERAFEAGSPGLAPGQLARELARLKAEAVAAHHPDAAVIGGDQLVALDGSSLGKPGTVEAAVAQLAAMAGRPHELLTAIHVVHAGQVYAHMDVATMHVRPLTSDEIRRYVEADLPLDCAGSYRVESRGIALFDRIEAADHSAIIGLPLIALTTILRTIGLAIP